MVSTIYRLLVDNKARLTQLASRYIGAGLVMLAGTLGVFQGDGDAQQLNDASTVFATFAVGLLLLGLDLLIHRLDRGGVVADDPKKAKKLTQEKS